MSIAKVEIVEENGNVGGVVATSDGVAGLILSGVSVTGKIQENTPIQVFSLEAAVDGGITKTGLNAFAYKSVKAFYDVAGSGSELWIMVTSGSHGDLFDPSTPAAQAMVNAANSKLRLLGVSLEFDEELDTSIERGIVQDVFRAIPMAHNFAQTNTQGIKPLVVMLDAKGWTGVVADLEDLKTRTDNHVQVLLGATDTEQNAAIGLAVGYSAILPVQRKKSRVKNGSIPNSETYFTDGSTTESREAEWDALCDRGYVFFMTRQGKSGYFFTSDQTATSNTDDYYLLPRRRIMNKAIELAYAVYVNELDDEIPVEDDGTIDRGYAKYLEGLMNNQLAQGMIALGEVSNARTEIDTTTNIVLTNKTMVKVSILPVAYGETIEATVGFTAAL